MRYNIDITMNVIISKLTYSGVGQCILTYQLPLRLSSSPALPLLCLYSLTPVGWITSSTLALGYGRKQARHARMGAPHIATVVPTARGNSLASSAIVLL
jgi:hypothetical protein